MSFGIRISIGILFLILTSLMYSQPKETHRYIDKHYLQFRTYINHISNEKIDLPMNLVYKMPLNAINVFPALTFVAALMVFFNVRNGIKVFAYIGGILCTILHMPYEGMDMAQQLRKLIFVFGVFLSMILMTTMKDKQEEKTKTE